MHKTAKGVAAAAAASALLLTSYGTYALWSDNETLNGGNVEAGELKITDATAGVWRDASAGGAGTVIPDITTFLVVPGDILTYTVDATVLAKGQNLQATLTADPTSVTGDTPLTEDVDVTTAVTVAGVPAATITEADDGEDIEAVIRLAFSPDSGNDTQLQGLDLSALQLVLQQNPR